MIIFLRTAASSEVINQMLRIKNILRPQYVHVLGRLVQIKTPAACPPFAGLLPILRGKNCHNTTEFIDCMRWVSTQHTMLARLNLTCIVENRPARGSGRGAAKHYGIPRLNRPFNKIKN